METLSPSFPAIAGANRIRIFVVQTAEAHFLLCGVLVCVATKDEQVKRQCQRENVKVELVVGAPPTKVAHYWSSRGGPGQGGSQCNLSTPTPYRAARSVLYGLAFFLGLSSSSHPTPSAVCVPLPRALAHPCFSRSSTPYEVITECITGAYYQLPLRELPAAALDAICSVLVHVWCGFHGSRPIRLMALR